MNRRSLLTTTTTFLREALAKAFCCRRVLLFSLSVLLLPPARMLGAGVQALFFFIASLSVQRPLNSLKEIHAQP